MRSRRLQVLLGWALAPLVVACGSRTGLLVNDRSSNAGQEAGQDAGTQTNEHSAPSNPSCEPQPIALSRADPSVMFVLDRSPSMNTAMVTGGNRSRWQALSSALAATLPSVDSRVAIGAMLFPSPGSTQACFVSKTPELAPALEQVDALLALTQSYNPGGSTPTAAALQSAGEFLLARRAASTARALVLATDGLPDCNASLDPATCRCIANQSPCPSSGRCLDDARTIEVIADLYTRGLPTYVIAIQSDGDSRFSDVLDAMAVAGGRAQVNGTQRYYAATSESELNLALATIRDQVDRCTFLTQTLPDPTAHSELTLDSTRIDASRWSWQNEQNGELVLAADLCQELADDAVPQLLTTRLDCPAP